MHKKYIGIIHFFLILAVISMGLPRFMAGDLNQDREIDLADAIIGAKNFAQTAERPATFAENIKTAVSAIQQVAGLETKITSEKDKNMASNPDQNCLVSETAPLAGFPVFSQLSETTLKYRSIQHLPQIPPPRLSTEI